MSNREFSSPVCYLDYDAQPVASSPALCERCKSVTAAFELACAGSLGDTPLLETSIDLSAISKPQCFLCRQFYWKVATFENEISQLQNDSSIPITFSLVIIDNNEFIRLTLPSTPGIAASPFLDLKVLDSSEDLELIDDKTLGISTSSDTAMTTTSSWIYSCSLQHRHCHRTSNFLPTRLVDVGSKSTPLLRLTLREHIPPNSRYLTLSHCWGNYIPVLLLSENLSTFIKQIDFSKLSKTFQDAIILSRKLNCQYIWIDSLCIIQDSFVDWQHESTRMREVYSNSFCNISASASTDGSEGLFRSRNLNSSEDKVLLKGRFSSSRSLYGLWDIETWYNNVEKSPLNTRGWVCQERFLSPSNLHFGSDQLFWECKQLAACETFPRGFPSSLEKLYNTRIKNNISECLREDSRYSSRHNSWNKIVRIYTASKLTFARDKLVAFAGLAELWGKKTEDDYLAGLWRKRLPHDLFWRINHPRRDWERRDFTAPSWSWASTDGEVVYDDSHSTTYITRQVTILEAKVYQIMGEGKYGQVKSGFMRMKNRLALGRYDPNEEGFRVQTSANAFESISDLRIWWDRPKGWRMNWENHKEDDQELAGIYLLPALMASTVRHSLSGPKPGLVLRRSRDDSHDFVRLGMFEVMDGGFIKLYNGCGYFDQCPVSKKLEREEAPSGDVEYTFNLL